MEILKEISNNAIKELKDTCDKYPDLIHQESDVKCYLFYCIHKDLTEKGLSNDFAIHTETQIEGYRDDSRKKAFCDLGVYKREDYNKNILNKPLIAFELKTSDAPRPKRARRKNLHSVFMKQFNKTKSDYERLSKIDIHLKYVIFVDLERIPKEWSNERENYFKKELSHNCVNCYYIRCNKQEIQS